MIDAIFKRHGIAGTWTPLPAHGIANTIYATDAVVLRIATDHEQAIEDARTELVAAPVARAAGIRVPALIAAGELDGRPYSLWERIHAATLIELASPPVRIWRELGAELAHLHARVTTCPDPNGHLDLPTHKEDPRHDARVAELLTRLRPFLDEPAPRRFLHNDVHAGNIMCTPDGELVALIDWGDAGWGDPTIELAALPGSVIPHVIAGYREAGGDFGAHADYKILYDQIASALDDDAVDELLALPWVRALTV